MSKRTPFIRWSTILVFLGLIAAFVGYRSGWLGSLFADETKSDTTTASNPVMAIDSTIEYIDTLYIAWNDTVTPEQAYSRHISSSKYIVLTEYDPNKILVLRRDTPTEFKQPITVSVDSFYMDKKFWLQSSSKSFMVIEPEDVKIVNDSTSTLLDDYYFKDKDSTKSVEK